MVSEVASARRPVRWPLLALLLLALALRVFWALTQTSIIEIEGAEYARIAENLLRGTGYVGTMPGPQLLFPPLYPLLIAATTLGTGNSELAGRVVSIMAGVGLVLAVYALAAWVYGSRVGLVAAMFTAAHPMLIALSGSVFSEAPYITLLTAGFYWSLRTAAGRGWVYPALAGLCFGLAYLTRQEGLIYLLLFIAYLGGLALLRQRAGGCLPDRC